MSMVQYCFTSTETIMLFRTESPGRPPRLSHSSLTLPIFLCPRAFSSASQLEQVQVAMTDRDRISIVKCFFVLGLFLRLHRAGVDGGDAAVAGRSAGGGGHQVR